MFCNQNSLFKHSYSFTTTLKARNFSCFCTKIYLSSICRAKRFQTAEPLEAATVSASQFHNPQQNPLQIVGPGGEAICEKICLIRVICGALTQLFIDGNPAFQAGLDADFQIHRHMAQLTVAPCHKERTQRDILSEQLSQRTVVFHFAARP